MIQALGTLRIATGVVQGHSVAGIHNRGDETSFQNLFSFQNKQGPPGREAVNLAVGFTPTHTVNTVEPLENVFRVPAVEWPFPDPDRDVVVLQQAGITEGIVPSNAPSPAHTLPGGPREWKGTSHHTVGTPPPGSIPDNH